MKLKKAPETKTCEGKVVWYKNHGTYGLCYDDAIFYAEHMNLRHPEKSISQWTVDVYEEAIDYAIKITASKSPEIALKEATNDINRKYVQPMCTDPDQRYYMFRYDKAVVLWGMLIILCYDYVSKRTENVISGLRDMRKWFKNYMCYVEDLHRFKMLEAIAERIPDMENPSEEDYKTIIHDLKNEIKALSNQSNTEVQLIVGKNGQTRTVRVTAKRIGNILSKYNLEKGLLIKEWSAIMSEITGLAESSFNNYIKKKTK